MCETRTWTSIFAYAKIGHLVIGGNRSDGLVFQMKVTDIELPEIIKAIKKLESFRSCKCEANKLCTTHKEQL